MDLSNNNNDNKYKAEVEESGGHSPNHQQLVKVAQHKNENQSPRSEQFADSNKEVRRRRSIREYEQQQQQQQQNDQNRPKDSLACSLSLKSNSNGNNGAECVVTGVSSVWRMEESSFSRSRISSDKENQKVIASLTVTGASMDKEVDKIIDRDMNEDENNDEEEEEDDSATTPATEVASAELDASCSSSLSSSYLLARVDPIVDFFLVDDELLGRFRICSCSTSTTTVTTTGSPDAKVSLEGGGIQPAIIFKIKTTSPYAFWVRPIYGLMRPNVICWVEVKCDMNREAEMNSRAKLVKNMDEFLVEICPVPGAISTMTSDLYTSAVGSNLPELLNIWEKVEQELTQHTEQQQRHIFVKEFHRVSCRFQRQCLALPSAQSSGVTSPLLVLPVEAFQQDPQKQKDNENHNNKNNMQQGDANGNNNVKIFQRSPSKTTAVGSEECFHLAREFPYHPHPFQEEQRIQEENADSLKRDQFNNQCCASRSQTVKKLCFLSFVLAILLLASLSFIFYTEFGYLNRYINNNPPLLHGSTSKNLQNRYYSNNNNELNDKSNKTNFNG